MKHLIVQVSFENIELWQVLIFFFNLQLLTLLACIIKIVSATDLSEYQDVEYSEPVKKPIIPILKHEFEQHDKGYRYR